MSSNVWHLVGKHGTFAAAALVLLASLTAAGCGEKSVNQLANDKFGASQCSKAGLAEIAGDSRTIWSCYLKTAGTTTCVFVNDGDLYTVTPDQANQLGISC